MKNDLDLTPYKLFGKITILQLAFGVIVIGTCLTIAHQYMM